MNIRFQLLILLLFAPLASQGDDRPICFLTQPRTGRTWSSYITQYFTHKPFYNFDLKSKRTPFSQLKADRRLSPIYRTHFISEVPKKFISQGGLLILTLRDHRECLFRGCKNRVEELSREIEERLDRYVDIIRYFDQFPKENRLLVQYENLITNPAEVITELFQFLHHYKLTSDRTAQSFIDDYSTHRSFMIRYYDRKLGSYTKGKKIDYHKNKLSPLVVQQIEEYLSENHPIIWKKYLRRYSVLSL